MRFSQATLRRSRVACENRIARSEEHTSELQSRLHLVCRLLLEKKKHTNELESPLQLVCRLLLETIHRRIRAASRYPQCLQRPYYRPPSRAHPPNISTHL